ncbi:MAG: FAD-dependent oxidoreductase [Salibacteraceae bacterium]
MISYWEQTELLRHDVAIVGGGIVGLSIAASIKERYPNRDVTIFERSFLPYGASTRNAGFACFGSLTEIMSDIKCMGEEATRELVFSRWLGLQITRKRLSDRKIHYFEYGGFEIVPDGQHDLSKAINDINHLCSDFQPDYLSLLSNNDTTLNLGAGHTLVKMNGEGQLNPGALMRNLSNYCQELGVMMVTGTEVSAINTHEGQFTLKVEDMDRGTVDCSAQTAVVAVNAFTEQFNDGVGVVPGRGQILVTEPIVGLDFKGNLHLDEGFYYLRNIGDRILFGGGRNMDFSEEATHTFGLNDKIQDALESKLQDLFTFKRPPEIDFRWSGIMGFGEQKTPIVKVENSGLIFAARLGGMGIALAGFIGEQVTDLIDSKGL